MRLHPAGGEANAGLKEFRDILGAGVYSYPQPDLGFRNPEAFRPASPPCPVDKDGYVHAPEKAGLGIE